MTDYLLAWLIEETHASRVDFARAHTPRGEWKEPPVLRVPRPGDAERERERKPESDPAVIARFFEG